MYMHGSLIGYETATIKRVVLSSTEAECNAMMLLGKENIWQRRLYKELMGIQELQPTQVKGDNAASLLLLDSGVTKRSKHFAIEWFKVKELVEEKEMEVEWVDGEHNLADFFTKKLPTTRCISLRNQIMQCDSEPVIVGCVYDEECGCNGQLDQHRWWAELNADVFMGEPQADDYDTVSEQHQPNQTIETWVYMARNEVPVEEATPPEANVNNSGNTIVSAPISFVDCFCIAHTAACYRLLSYVTRSRTYVLRLPPCRGYGNQGG